MDPQTNGAMLGFILSLFNCCGCPSHLGRQQVARVSNTKPPGLAILWIIAVKAECPHVSCDTFRPCLLWPLSSSGTSQNISRNDQIFWKTLVSTHLLAINLTINKLTSFYLKFYSLLIAYSFLLYECLCSKFLHFKCICE